jgi:hypothetical protein
MGEVRTRRYNVSVPTDGSESSLIFIGNEPSCAGWLLSFKVELPAGSMISCDMTCRDDWENNSVGLEFYGWAVESGGQLFVPYPSMDLSFTDFLQGGGGTEATVQVTARSVARGTQIDHSKSVMYGLSGPKSVDSGATETLEKPAGASGYQIGLGKAGGPWEVRHQIDPGGGVGNLVLSYFLADSTVDSSPDVGGENWRLLIPADGSEVTAKNTHASASGTINVFWKYSLRSVH